MILSKLTDIYLVASSFNNSDLQVDPSLHIGFITFLSLPAYLFTYVFTKQYVKICHWPKNKHSTHESWLAEDL